MKEIDNNILDLSKPTLIVAPGNSALSKFVDNHNLDQVFGGGTALSGDQEEIKKRINGYMKIAERIIGGKDSMEKLGGIYALSYTDTSLRSLSTINMMNYNDNPNTYSDNHISKNHIAKFTVDNFLNLVADDAKVKLIYKNKKGGGVEPTGEWKARGTQKDMESLKSGLNNVNILSYSYGTTIAGMICNCMKKIMKDVGYSHEQTKEALSAVKMVAPGSLIAVEDDSMMFTSLLIEGRQDRVLQKYLPSKVTQEAENLKKVPSQKELNDSVHRITIDLPEKIRYKPYVNNLEEPKPIVEESDPHSYHLPRLYMSYRVDGDNLIPALIENTTRNMIKNVEFKDLTDLLKMSSPYGVEETAFAKKNEYISEASYNEQIKKLFDLNKNKEIER